MATVAANTIDRMDQPRGLSGTPMARAIDRWIYVFTAASFIVITLVGFIPDSLMKVALVKAGQRPPFPTVLHFHAVLMGSFLLVLLAQTWLMATGKATLHFKLGVLGMALAAALVAAGLILVPTMYHMAWGAAHFGPPEVRQSMTAFLPTLDNIMLFQLRIGLLFPLFLLIGLRARGRNAGFHKRMMILATVVALPAAIDRITWLPSTLPNSPLATDLYMLAAVSPMFLWDVTRNRGVHPAYKLWLAVFVIVSIPLYMLWGTPLWQATAPHLMGI